MKLENDALKVAEILGLGQVGRGSPVLGVGTGLHQKWGRWGKGKSGNDARVERRQFENLSFFMPRLNRDQRLFSVKKCRFSTPLAPTAYFLPVSEAQVPKTPSPTCPSSGASNFWSGQSLCLFRHLSRKDAEYAQDRSGQASADRLGINILAG